jgi:hypothetical protein
MEKPITPGPQEFKTPGHMGFLLKLKIPLAYKKEMNDPRGS